MDYLIRRTVIAAARLEAGEIVPAAAIGTGDQVARLLELGAIAPAEAAPDDTGAPGPEEELRAAMIQAINNLPKDGFTSSRKPSVEAIEAALPEHAERIDAALRDAVWDEMKAAAEAAS